MPRTNRDGGLSGAAAKLEKGQTSPAVKTSTGDGYYFVRLLDKNDTQLSYAYLKIPLTKFAEQLKGLRGQNKVQEYISVPSGDSLKFNQ